MPCVCSFCFSNFVILNAQLHIWKRSKKSPVIRNAQYLNLFQWIVRLTFQFSIFLEFFNIFHVISMILNEHDLLLHDIHNSICSAISSLLKSRSILFIAYIPFSRENQLHPFYRIYSIFPRKSAPSFLSHIFYFPGKISSILFRWVIYLYIKVLFKSLLEKNDVISSFFSQISCSIDDSE